MLFLTIHRADGASDTKALGPGLTVVGRAPDCDVVVHDDSISRHHAQIVIDGERASVVDLHSSNGVFRNGERVTESPVEPGDALRFGAVEASIERRSTEPERPAAPVATPSPVGLEHTIYRRVDPAVQAVATAVDANRVIRLLAEIGRTLAASLSLGDTLDRVVTLLLGHVPADRARLSMRSSAADDFVSSVTRLKEGSTASPTFEVSRTVIDLVLRERVAVLTADVSGDSRFDAAQSLYRDDVRSLMCAPLLADDAVIGLLYVDNSWTRQFSVADLELFTAIADYASVAIAQARLAGEVEREARRRERLARYHSPAVVERVLQDDRSSEAIVGQERDVTVLFADIVGFTSMAEEMPPLEVVRLLCQFFSRMSDVVFAHEGTVDKFIGDAILVIFGAPTDQIDHAARAVATATDMLAAVADLNERHVAPRPLRIRVAIHSGLAIVGDVGSSQRLEYTVVGDVVNTAARLQSEIAAPDEIVLSRATLDRVGGPLPVEAIGVVQVRGRLGAVEAFRLAGRAPL